MILVEAKMLTGSEHGFVSTIDPETKDAMCHTLTKMMDKCRLELKILKLTSLLERMINIMGYGGHSLNTSQSFFTNTPKEHKSATGTPTGQTCFDIALLGE